MKPNFVLWTEKIEPNAVALETLSGVEDEWELNEA